MSALIILVNADRRTLRHTEALLSEQGYLVAPVASFREARHLLASVLPDLLITDFRLKQYNGLQLAALSYLKHPDVPVIVTYTREAPVADAARYGAVCVASPLENPEFLLRVRDAVAQRRRQPQHTRRWFRKPVFVKVEVDAAQTRAQILDLSYAGVRLAFRDLHHIPENFDIALPTGGFTVTARRVWVVRSADGEQVCCGAQLEEPSTGHWRAFVNSLPDHEAP